MGDLNSFDQGCRQFKRSAQCQFFARHFTIIALVVKARQMKNSMQCKDLDFVGNGMPQPYGVLQRDVGGDRDVAR